MKMMFFAVILITIFFVEFNVLNSACPDPTDTERFVNVWVGGCEYEVQVCFKCAGTTPYGHVNVVGFGKIDPNCVQSFSTYQVFEQICQQIYDYNFIKTFICLDEQLVPCEPWDGGIYFNFYREMCWMKKLLSNGTIWYSTCNLANTYCFEAWKMCFDPSLPYPHIKYTQLAGPYISGNYEELCEGVTEPPNPTIFEVYSTCFELKTPCNP